VIGNDGANIRRIAFMSVSVFLTGIATFISEIYLIWTVSDTGYSVFAQMLMSGVHMTMTATALFVFHGSGGVEYEEIGAKQDLMVLELEHASGDDDPEESDGQEID
jgi:hypothetical protein